MAVKSRAVYVPMSADLFHASHVRLLEQASGYREIEVGLNSDEVIEKKKGRLPVLPFYNRKKVLESVKYINKIRKVDDYMQELDNHSHLTIIHGDDWPDEFASRVKYMCTKNGGRLILLPYGDGINSTKIKKKIQEQSTQP